MRFVSIFPSDRIVVSNQLIVFIITRLHTLVKSGM
nr:MAG TPA: hypothetical protein [Caudoviricetes sp.]